VAGLVAADVAPLAAAVHPPAMNILAGMAASVIMIRSSPCACATLRGHSPGANRPTREEREAEPLPH
jgi:hypothetical protein